MFGTIYHHLSIFHHLQLLGIALTLLILHLFQNVILISVQLLHVG